MNPSLVTPPPKPRRPASLDQQTAAQLPGGLDPAERSRIAHHTAHVLVSQGRDTASTDPEILDRLVHLVETEGIDLLAELWATAAPDTLPGTLWRLYTLREWVRTDPAGIAAHFRDGVHVTPVPEVVAGAGLGYGPGEMLRLLDAILTGVYTGDLAVALERAAAFCEVMAVGTVADADRRDIFGSDDERTTQAAQKLTDGARNLSRTAAELQQAATLWRTGHLD